MVRIADTSTPVVILRAVAHGPLGILRSLGRLGVPVYVVEADPSAPAYFSRYCRGKFSLDLESMPPAEAVAGLLDFARKIGRRAILIPTSDEAAIFVADNADALGDSFLFQQRSSELVRTLCSKKEMYFLAKRCRVPTPEVVFPQSRTDVLEFVERAAFPVVLKGIDGLRLLKQTGKRMFIVPTGDELLQKYDQIDVAETPNLMLQEYIPGGDDTVWMFNGYFDQSSECLVGFTGKKIRQCPVHRGVTSLGICLKNETVDKTTKEFMKAIGYQGILDIGYRYDARDGRYKVLDVNPRIGATFRLFVSDNGMDVARALYLHLTGQPVIPGMACEGRKWIVEDLDAVSCIRYGREGELKFGEWAQSYGGIQETAYFASDDPMPLLPMLINDCKDAVGRISRGLRAGATRFLSPSPSRRSTARCSSSAAQVLGTPRFVPHCSKGTGSEQSEADAKLYPSVK